MLLDLPDIVRLFQQRGGVAYSGEAVSQTEHALQSATLAQQAGAGDALVTAALLHDLGHLLGTESSTLERSPTELGIDDCHQCTGPWVLRGLFGPDVLQPIRLHVNAKRYLCAVRPGYEAALSADSVRSLRLQGGAYGPGQAAEFIGQAGAADAVRLRLWDDAAKVAGLPTPPLEHFFGIAQRVRLPVWPSDRAAPATGPACAGTRANRPPR